MSERLVADTNVLSYIFNGHSLAQLYKPKLEGHVAAVSFQTLAELRLGAVLARWGERRKGQLERFLQAFVVVFPNDALCHRWALVRAESLRAGQPIDTADAWIAATALELNVSLVTHNAKDFSAVKGLQLIAVGT